MNVALLLRSWLLVSPALLAASADDTARQAQPCNARGVAVLVYEGSRLFRASAAQLGLARGRAMACNTARASAVIAALEAALESFPSERLGTALRVHVDPRLPRHEAPVTGIEVHATSREILVRGAALAWLPSAAWRHELLHSLAPPPPVASLLGRRSWLTLEEGLVAHLTLALEPDGAERTAIVPERHAPSDAWEELTLPNYDPHSLASGLTRELQRGASKSPGARDALLDCLLTAPAPSASERVRDVTAAFVSRCRPESAGLLAEAAGRWLPEALSPWPQPVARAAIARDSENR